MKNLNRIIPVSMLLLAIFIMVNGCKKDEPDPVPTFTITYDSVNLQAGGKGLQFYAVCTNNGVTMSKVTITTPDTGTYLYDFNGASYSQNARFGMQSSDQAYPKRIGTWKFNLAGASSGGTAFVNLATLNVPK